MPVRKTGDYTFLVPAAGPGGSYDVDVFGRGPQGDVITTFAWTTTEAGMIPAPEAAVAFLTDLDDDVVSYGMELTLDGTTYVGTAAWPRDENDQPPYTDLTFSPPLPAFTG